MPQPVIAGNTNIAPNIAIRTGSNRLAAGAVLGDMKRSSARLPALASAAALGLTAGLAAGCGTGSHPAPGGPAHSASASPSRSCGPATGSAGSGAAQGQASQQPVLNGVQFVSASTGWVVGSDRILHTADGGRHWDIQYRTATAAQLSSVDFADANHGWVVGASTVLATTDGGAHWQPLAEPCHLIRAVHFVSPADGFAVAGGSLPSLAGPAVGGVLLSTADGGQTWRSVTAPADVQTVCFSNPRHGWLGAGGSIYGTANGGRTWTLAVRGPGSPGGRPDTHAVAVVECAGSSAGWAELIGPGAAMNHQPQIGYHTFGRTWQPIFAEQYTAGPSLRRQVRADSPGVYPGPFSSISPDQAVFVGYCAPCSLPRTPQLQGTAPMDVAAHGGTVLVRRGLVGQLAEANGAAFVTADDGWVVGTQTSYPLSSSGSGRAPKTVTRIMHTADGGRTWQVQYALGGL
jgi:Photosynthesis system II assembly factor YCF48